MAQSHLSFNCQVCGAPFTSVRPNAKYCGGQCRKKAEREALKVRDWEKSGAPEPTDARVLHAETNPTVERLADIHPVVKELVRLVGQPRMWQFYGTMPEADALVRYDVSEQMGITPKCYAMVILP